jgi:hypothetical protein
MRRACGYRSRAPSRADLISYEPTRVPGVSGMNPRGSYDSIHERLAQLPHRRASCWRLKISSGWIVP